MGRNSFARRPVLLLALLGLTACAVAAPFSETGTLPEPYHPEPARGVLAAEDVLAITVFGHEELSSPPAGTRVDAEGLVHLAVGESVRVAGLTVSEARGALEASLGRYVKRPSVGLSVLEHAPRSFYLLGEVQESGERDLARPMNALQALGLGLGFKPGADREHVAHLRVVGDELVVRFFDAATPGPEGVFPIRPGDVLFVRQSGSGAFRDQILPILQGIALPVGAIASLVIASEALNQ